jgi:acyl carrier protein
LDFADTAVEVELRQILSDLAQLPSGFSAQADLYSELGMPSVKAMQLLLELEDRFGIAVPDEDFVEATTLDKLTALVSGLKKPTA